ncbi:MAG TPA: N-acetylmuramoyl-L-alanine amidase [Gammaproteobacteria bacterium]|nr:N-acetylmuramoyl-L-alanine amidase [Gammaproteobacteria bacterium]
MRWIFVLYGLLWMVSSANNESVVEFSLTRTSYAKTYFNSGLGVLNITASSSFNNLNLKQCSKPNCSIQSMKFSDNKMNLILKIINYSSHQLQYDKKGQYKLIVSHESQPVIQKATTNRPYIVVIDPGHGGSDPGATSNDGVTEKEITLAIGRLLAKQLNKMEGIRAILTRTHDKTVTLRERLRYSSQYSADLFVSIHADAFINKQAKGISVYALSEKGSTSATASWLAARENKSFTMEVGDVEIKNKDLQNLIFDLSQKATNKKSITIGSRVLQGLGNVSTLHSPHVEQAAFIVLKSPATPAILIETGFISNEREARYLQDKSYQHLIAGTIADAIKSSSKHKGHSGVSSQQAKKLSYFLHKVAKSETLYQLSKRYGVSTSDLRSINHLSSNTISISQIIKVPKHE